MMGQAAPVNIVRPFTQKIEHLRKGQRHQKIVGAIGVADTEESGRAPVAHAVKLQLVIGHDLPELGNVKGSQPGAAGNQNAFCGFAAGQLVLLILFHRKAIRLALFQPLEHIVHGVEKVLVILLHFHAGDHVNQRIHVEMMYPSRAQYKSVSAFVQNGSPSLPSPLVLEIKAFTNFKMSASFLM